MDQQFAFGHSPDHITVLGGDEGLPVMITQASQHHATLAGKRKSEIVIGVLYGSSFVSTGDQGRFIGFRSN
jgi:hypothetical protein